MDESILDNIETKAEARVKSALQHQPPTYLTGIEQEEEFVDERNLPQLPPIQLPEVDLGKFNGRIQALEALRKETMAELFELEDDMGM